MNIKILFLILILIGILSCTSKNTPEYVAKQYLTALKDKDWETAKKYATKNTCDELDMAKELGTDFGIIEIKDIRCEGDEDSKRCFFCCSKDSVFSCIHVIRDEQDGKWKAYSSKEVDTLCPW
jgi:hypothetical protein